MRLIGFYNYTVILTYISLVSSVLGMKFAYDKNMDLAILCLFVSGVCDLFDGVVARSKKNRTADEKSFGIQIDSLCDLICFGVYPAIILFFSGVNTTYGIAILVLYVLCAVIRLAFFNVLEIKRQASEDGCAKAYRGLPVTTVSLLLPLVYLIGFAAPAHVMRVVYYLLPLFTGLLFIADFRFPKVDVGKLFHKAQADADSDDVITTNVVS